MPTTRPRCSARFHAYPIIVPLMVSTSLGLPHLSCVDGVTDQGPFGDSIADSIADSIVDGPPAASPILATDPSPSILAPATTDVPTTAYARSARQERLDRFYAHRHLVQVDVEMDRRQWERLRNARPHGTWEHVGSRWDWYQADRVTVDGTVFSRAGIRKKGFHGSFSTSKPALRINLDQFVDENERRAEDTLGTTNLVLNNSIQDPTLVRQCIVYEFSQWAGLPAPRCNLAQVRVNGANLGVYVNVERVGKQFVRNAFGNRDGNLYEIEGEDFADWAVHRIDLKGFSGDDSKRDLWDAVHALANHGVQGAERVINIDQYLTFWAVEHIAGHQDSYSDNLNNVYVYRNPADNRFSFIIWGADRTFGWDSFRGEPYLYKKAIVARLLADNSYYRDALAGRVRHLLDTVWDEERVIRHAWRLAEKASPVLSSGDRDVMWRELHTTAWYIRQVRPTMRALFGF
jgi:hypothetical protein